MSRPPRVLFVQHAGSLGGSCVSLLATIAALDRSRFEPVLAIANDAPSVAAYYRSAGLEPLMVPGLAFWNHTTGGVSAALDPRTWHHLGCVATAWRRTERLTLELARASGADLVHLNSVVLAGSASALSRGGVPYVWHIREHPPSQGLRTAFIRRLLLRHPRCNVFISQADQFAWTGRRDGNVIPNFVAPADWSTDRQAARQALGIPDESPTVLYAGGLSALKGILPLLRALVEVQRHIPSLRVLMPGALYSEPPRRSLRYMRNVLPWFGLHTTAQAAVEQIERTRLKEACICLPFQYSMAPMYAAADVVVFPALRPHFARPVIEAAAAGVPAIASRLSGIEELVVDGQSGMLLPPGDWKALKDAMHWLLTERHAAKRLGEAARQLAATRFSAAANVSQIMHLYDTILDGANERS